jgi:hypothetical protein
MCKTKLWLLRPVENLPDNDNPWDPWYDKVFGFVIRAETETEARNIAHTNAGDETEEIFLNERISYTPQPWKDAKYSTCIELLSEGPVEVIIRDFASA